MIALRERPRDWRYTPRPHWAKRGLVFHMGGWMAGSNIARDGDGMPGRVKNHGTLTNMDPTDWVWSDYLGRWCLDFDGSTNYVLLPALNLNMPTTSVCLWANPSSVSWNRGNAFAAYDAPDVWKVASIGLKELATSKWRGGAYAEVVSNDGAIANRWTHVAVVTRGGTTYLYIDGVQQTATASATAGTLDVCSISSTSAGANKWLGKISDVLVFKRPPSDTEIKQLARPDNWSLSGLIEPLEPAEWPTAVVSNPFVTEDTFRNASPYDNAEPIGTVQVIGGTSPYSFKILSEVRQ